MAETSSLPPPPQAWHQRRRRESSEAVSQECVGRARVQAVAPKAPDNPRAPDKDGLRPSPQLPCSWLVERPALEAPLRKESRVKAMSQGRAWTTGP